jgi:4-hydroxy-3-polyprenylbenzoate decarboxylase
MAYTSLNNYINILLQNGSLKRIEHAVSPVLEMAEITDRLSKNKGPAVLFTNTGTDFPVLMNAFGSKDRMLTALGMKNYTEFDERITSLLSLISTNKSGLRGKLAMLSKAKELGFASPKRSNKRLSHFHKQMDKPDLDKLPILQCWPHDGGKFITLPMVHTKDPETGITNVGMYRMQIFDSLTTGMHWHTHKGGAAHYEKYKKLGQKIPVVVTLGGDPVYTYSATAPLPEMISEYAFAGFLRKKKVHLVKCMTCDIEVPEDVDFVIEGYIDPEEELRTEGPFGDHTGFYSLPDKYPVFHITHISHRKDAVYPATIVGIPPMEDAFLGEATEQLFLPLIKSILASEIKDMYLPPEGGFHNLAIVSIRKSYPGQAVKVMNALWGAGQMMFVKNIIVVNEDVDVRNASKVAETVMKNCIFERDFHFMNGPLDVLDHASSTPLYGKKTGIDATNEGIFINGRKLFVAGFEEITDSRILFPQSGTPLSINFVDKSRTQSLRQLHSALRENGTNVPFIVYLDHRCSHLKGHELLWMFLANFDPGTDLYVEKTDIGYCVGFDGTMKRVEDGIAMPRPNLITSDEKTIRRIDEIWDNLNLGDFIESPSLKYKKITPGYEGYLYDK